MLVSVKAPPTLTGRCSCPLPATPYVQSRGAVGRIRVRSIAGFAAGLLSAATVAAQTAVPFAASEAATSTVVPTPVKVPTPRRAVSERKKEIKPTSTKKKPEPPAAAAGGPTDFGPPLPGDEGDLQGVAGSAAILGGVSSPTLGSAAAASSAANPASSAPPLASVTPPATFEVAEVRIRDSVILSLKLEDGGLVPKERARRAKQAIEDALADASPDSVRTEMRQDRALIFVGQRPIVELTRADAEAIGEGSLELFAASAAARVTDVLESERQRSVVLRSVLNITLVIFLAVAVLYALRALGALARRSGEFVRRNPQRIPAIRFRSIEVIGPHVLRAGIIVGIGVLKLLLQLGLVFAWLLFSLSLFDATRGLTGKLTTLVVDPLSGLATRFAALLPLLLLTTIGVVVLVVLLRFVALFFAGVERRETELKWLKPELAAPTSLLIRIGLVVFSLLVLAPLVTGNVEGSLARVGMLSVVAIALATTPFVANTIVGLYTLYGSRLKLGDEIQIGSQRGTLTAVDLVELRLRADDEHELRIPHLVTLVRPIIVSSATTGTGRQLIVTAEERFARLLELLSTDEIAAMANQVRVVRVEGDRTTVELTPLLASASGEQQLLAEVLRLMESKSVRLVIAEWRDQARA